ncbi:MAG: oxidoreductase, short chain dehydrogenase/reductase family [Cryobacterium sp.]|jgi:retinol dehydrogenase-12|nr:oxidoreductase, short chain dehydrogenase/reductase family [Cryobacterium sp.]
MESAVKKTYLVTGGTSGIGQATATELARAGHRVLIGGRSAEHAEKALATIRSRVPRAALETVIGDLAEMKQVRTVSENVFEKTDRIDGLILNAAVSRPRHELTSEGIEVNFATNYLAGFLLTNLLVPLLMSSGQGRVVSLSSAFHAHVKSLEVDALPSGRGIKPSKRYETTKLLNVLFVAEFARRFRETPLTANVADPGFVRTNLGRDTTGAFGLVLKLTRPMQDSPEKASETVVYLATSPEVATVSGGYFSGSAPTNRSPLSQDPRLASQLWDYSNSLLREMRVLEPGEYP